MDTNTIIEPKKLLKNYLFPFDETYFETDIPGTYLYK